MKFELTSNTRTENGKTLYQIRYLKDIRAHNIKAGTFGGWLESEANLSHKGDATVCGNACVFDKAYIGGDAYIGGSAKVYGTAHICHSARVSGNAEVFGDTAVTNFSTVTGDAKVYGNANIYTVAHISGKAVIKSNADFFSVCPVGTHGRVFTAARGEDGLVFSLATHYGASIDVFAKATAARLIGAYGRETYEECLQLIDFAKNKIKPQAA